MTRCLHHDWEGDGNTCPWCAYSTQPGPKARPAHMPHGVCNCDTCKPPAPQWAVGDSCATRNPFNDPEDDLIVGTIVTIDGGYAFVRWPNGARTSLPLADLTRPEPERQEVVVWEYIWNGYVRWATHNPNNSVWEPTGRSHEFYVEET